MKIKILMFAFLLMAIFTKSEAQSISEFRKLNIPTKSNRLTDSIHIMLSLNDKQTQQMHQIITDGLTEIQPIVHSDKSRYSKWRMLKGIRNKYQSQVKTILTKDQWAKWETEKKALIAYYKEQIGNIPLRTSFSN
ncbi:hypothetical protein [Rhizosphaericola mali]|uniref:Uncharacterized protein n=1 Tax=Rhizosphaericola mali TaxID=2545455 RepID=A0A5P2FYU1_9BACT|nr:hypothetical protein [Rhizosphaericola mali]QES88097.1 hypothetical protein E0W69_005260 [Rhizosphaericola mali]